MTTRTIIYLAILALALLSLALGGWAVKGVNTLVDKTRQTRLRPRFV
jgi:hypothetical protein